MYPAARQLKVVRFEIEHTHLLSKRTD